MVKRNVTIKDIAAALNLSISTVSKALKGSHEISVETQEMVKDYAKLIHYRPNPIAQNLRKGTSKSIAVIVPNIDNNFFSQIINGIESVAFEKEYNVIVTQTHESFKRELLTTEHHFSRSVDGMIVSISTETDSTDHFKEVQSNGIPIVFFDRVPEDIITHKVVSDNFSGAYDATRHLIEQGCKRIAHITSSNFVSITSERLAGYKKALEESGMKVDEKYIKYCIHGGMIPSEIRNAVNELLSLKPRPDAILAASDRLSTMTLDILLSLKIKVPSDIALVGFTNSVSINIFNPSLTAVVQPAFDIGAAATQMLIKMIESKRPVTDFQTKVLKTKLIVNKSSIKNNSRQN